MASSKEVKPYSYFDTPDGEDVIKKLWYVLKPTSLVAVGLSIADVLTVSQPKTYLQILGRFAYVSTPVLAAASSFVIITNMAASVRKKDDKFNWAVGGYAVGTVFGVWRKNFGQGLLVGTMAAAIAVGKKRAVQNNYTIIPPWNVQYSGSDAFSGDYTLTKERPKNWTTGIGK